MCVVCSCLYTNSYVPNLIFGYCFVYLRLHRSLLRVADEELLLHREVIVAAVRPPDADRDVVSRGDELRVGAAPDRLAVTQLRVVDAHSYAQRTAVGAIDAHLRGGGGVEGR